MRLKEIKNKSVYLRLTDQQYAYLDKVSQKACISISDLLRLYVDSIMFNSPLGEDNENNTDDI